MTSTLQSVGIQDRIIPFATYIIQRKKHYSTKIALPVGKCVHGITWISHSTAWRSVQPFLHITSMWPTQTHRPRYEGALGIYAVPHLQPEV